MDQEGADLEDAFAMSNFNVATLQHHVVDVSRKKWGVPVLPPGQVEITSFLLNPAKTDTIIAVPPPARGRLTSFVRWARLPGGIMLYFVPLLALSVNILQRRYHQAQGCGLPLPDKNQCNQCWD